MIINYDVDEFIEHFGIRGMHWGTRRAQSRDSGTVDKPVNNKKRNIKIGAIAVGAIGAAAVTTILIKNRSKKLNSIPRAKKIGVGYLYNQAWWDRYNAIPLNDIMEPGWRT